MNNFGIPKPSIIDLVRGKKSALLAGCGGGNDFIQTIPIVNLLKSLGVERFCLANIGCKWWYKEGEDPFGCEVLNLDWLFPCERVGEFAALISKDTKVTQGYGKGSLIQEASTLDIIDAPIAVISIRSGVQGAKRGFLDLIERFGSEIFITCDIGGDCFYTGTETQVMSPLADAISVLCASDLPVPGILSVAGLGCDAELPMSHLICNMATVTQKGGLLGAYGLTQDDLKLLEDLPIKILDEEVEKFPYVAARGYFGTHYNKRFWSVEVTPSAAVNFFLDPDTMREVNPIINAISETKTLQEAEDVIIRDTNIFPETRLQMTIKFPTDPQVPD